MCFVSQAIWSSSRCNDRQDFCYDILPSKHSTEPSKILENGTLNFEGCNRLIGLGSYVSALAKIGSKVTKVAQVQRSSQAGDDPIQRCKVAPIEAGKRCISAN